jgi:hypothetical protein
MINPGTQPVEAAREDLAVANLDAFLIAVRARAAEMDQAPYRRRTAGLDGNPVRDPAADRDGRFGWDLPLSDGQVVPVLIPGAELKALRDDVSASWF